MTWEEKLLIWETHGPSEYGIWEGYVLTSIEYAELRGEVASKLFRDSLNRSYDSKKAYEERQLYLDDFPDIKNKIEELKEARLKKDYTRADAIRKELTDQKVEIQIHRDGEIWWDPK